MRKNIITVLLVVTICIGSVVFAQPLLIGMLEQPQCKQDAGTAVRVLFANDGSDWKALDSAGISQRIDQAKLVWTVALDGRMLGSIETNDPGFHSAYSWAFSRDRLLAIAAGQVVPSVVNKEKAFGGWCDLPANRPLVLISRPNYRNPDAWKPTEPDDKYRQLLFVEFRKAAGVVKVCPNGPDSTPTPYNYSAEDLTVVTAYVSRSRRRLIAVALKADRYGCDTTPDVLAGPAWTPHWFVVDNGARYIGNTLSLIDAGDYDNDGKSEVVFWHSGYNEDGYTLLYDSFRKRVDYYWKYH